MNQLGESELKLKENLKIVRANISIDIKKCLFSLKEN